MAIGITRKEGERFVLISPTGEEAWVLIREGKAKLAFDLPAGWTIYREEIYQRNGGKPYRPAPIRPSIQAPSESPLAGTVFEGRVQNL